MNRVIKFRAWNRIVHRMQVFTLQDIEKQKGLIQWQNIEVMQFTGLLDKNKNEIYEGDIFGTPIQLRCVVEREEDGRWVLRFLDKRIKSISILDHKVSKSPIIGNVFQDPELISKP